MNPKITILPPATPSTPRKKLGKKARATTTQGHYLTNATLLPVVLEAKAQGKMTDELAKCLMLIAERFSRHPRFVGYPYRDELIATAMEKLVVSWDKFDPTFSDNPNPFSYYTQCFYNEFRGYCRMEKAEQDLKSASLQQLGYQPTFNQQVASQLSHDDNVA